MKKIFLAKRDISPELYQLENGNAYIEAKFLDSEHLIRLELEIDPREKRIIKARAEMPISPFKVCPQTTKKVKQLEGLVIERGVMAKIAEIFGGSCGCIHLRKLASEAVDFAAGKLIGYEEGNSPLSEMFEKQTEAIRFEKTEKALRNSCLAYKQNGNGREEK